MDQTLNKNQAKVFVLVHETDGELCRVLSPNFELADSYFKRHWASYWTNFKCAYFESVILDETNQQSILVKDCRTQ